jgi:hypothetical protein
VSDELLTSKHLEILRGLRSAPRELGHFIEYDEIDKEEYYDDRDKVLNDLGEDYVTLERLGYINIRQEVDSDDTELYHVILYITASGISLIETQLSAEEYRVLRFLSIAQPLDMRVRGEDSSSGREEVFLQYYQYNSYPFVDITSCMLFEILIELKKKGYVEDTVRFDIEYDEDQHIWSLAKDVKYPLTSNIDILNQTKHIIVDNLSDLAFLFGNGINRFGTSAYNSSWDHLLLSLWHRHLDADQESVPEGISLTEVYDILKLKNIDHQFNLQKEFCQLMDNCGSLPHHHAFINFAKMNGIPILTTNFDNVFQKVGQLNLRRISNKGFTDYYPWDSYFRPNRDATSNRYIWCMAYKWNAKVSS